MLDITKLFGNVKLSQIEETILTYLIENIDICINKGIRSIAKDNFTSPSTIIRLAKKLGYSGFVELMYSLKNKLSTETLDTFFDGINDKNIFNTNYDKACEDFIECIKDGNILISGEGFSEIVSKYMYMKLLVLGKKIILSTFIDFDILFDNHADTINSIILVSKSGEGNHCVNSCIHAKERNLKIISFTGNVESTLAKNSDITFIIPDCEKMDNDNYYPNPFFAYCIETFELMIHRYLNS
ncbi:MULTISPECIES: MurR/RpiR family transcriptional regulator [Clostridium]|uniref:MurR/RpiR family transcriptional regulator n=1 Tax=Clostridium TaxID=1485 RepID=UPI00257ADCD1|nr:MULTISPECIES: MurR/RpiR family transcriptional regulator [Clostridium]MBS4841622.1 MurR/RpiR family transcriptional regulator [Clostridium sp.]MDU1403107.1 MurR/RpiR family transcriptional regulator [Clostridium sp.]MDU1604539.1 MurR/RpiR family transcriptional regulator [Clostridium sp.]MDU2896232.1 MurR/RpiR family transcriptional regulator [Clostridium sp.]MDU3008641.1 MurR/RpiR family transcriptional regulator [Clostridium sp.]